MDGYAVVEDTKESRKVGQSVGIGLDDLGILYLTGAGGSAGIT